MTRVAPLPRIKVDVAGVQQLTVTATTEYRPYGSASKGWAALVQACLK